MRKYIQITLIILLLSSCSQQQNKGIENIEKLVVDSSIESEEKYSEEFLKHFQNSKMILKGDTIQFSAEADSAIVLIPQYIPVNQEISFETGNGQVISIRQLNYTDIEFLIRYKDKEYKGKASLFPHFYIGLETVNFSDGEYIITHYYVTETDNPCLDFIGLGNQNIIEENSESVYALVSVAGDTCEDELNELTHRKLTTVTSRVGKGGFHP